METLRELCRGIELRLVSQGAEAFVCVSDRHPFYGETECVVKYRPRKAYRHSTLDAQLIQKRTLAEARALHKLAELQVHVPRLLFVDPPNGLTWISYIDGPSLKQYIWEGESRGQALEKVLLDTGREIGKIHVNDVIHGDLTSSNILVHAKDTTPYVIDFGLCLQSTLVEDKAVDLYVLERSMVSTHPLHYEQYNGLLLQGYTESYRGKNGAADVLRRLQDVRLRGRKRSMLG